MTEVLEIYRPIVGDVVDFGVYADHVADIARLCAVKTTQWGDSPRVSMYMATGVLAEQLYDDDYGNLLSACRNTDLDVAQAKLKLVVSKGVSSGASQKDERGTRLQLVQNESFDNKAFSQDLVRALDRAVQFAREGRRLSPRYMELMRMFRPIPLLGFDNVSFAPTKNEVRRIRQLPELEEPSVSLGGVEITLKDSGEVDPANYGRIR